MKISLVKLSTKDLATLAERTINSSQTGNYTVIANHELLQEIIKEYTDYQKVYSKLTYSGKGQSVAEADATRDKIYSGIKAYLKGFNKLSGLPGHEDAIALYQIFKNYGLDLDRLSYSAETAQMNKLIADLEKPENVTKLASLNLTDFFAQLKQSQANFEALYAEQAEANADLHQLPSATSIRKRLELSLKNFFNLITAMKNVDGWKLLYADINEIVKAASQSVHHSSSATIPSTGNAQQ